MVKKSYLETGYHVAEFISGQKDMELRRSAIREILDQCTNPAGTLAKRHNKWLENSMNIAENWKGMCKLPENEIIGGSFVDAHRSSPKMLKMLRESAEAEVEIDQRHDISDDKSIKKEIIENLYEDKWRNLQRLTSFHHRDAETQIRLWVSTDIERFRANLHSDILGSGADPSRQTTLGFFEEWSAWNDNISGRSRRLENSELHPECYLIFSTIQFAIKDLEHRLSIIEEAQTAAEHEICATTNQVYMDVIEAYRTYENPDDPAAADKVYAQEIARHLVLP